MSEKAASATARELDACAEDEVVVVCGDSVLRVSYASLDAVLAPMGVEPVAFPLRWVVELAADGKSVESVAQCKARQHRPVA